MRPSPACPGEKVLAELLALHTTARAGRDHKGVVQKPLQHLDRVELAKAVEREADHVVVVLQVAPARVACVHERCSELGEDLLDERPLGAQAYPLTQIWAGTHGDAVHKVLAGHH